MRRTSTLYSLLTSFFSFLLLALFVQTASAQKQDIVEGKEFWFGLPHCKMLQAEPIRGEFPIVIWISSKVDTKATVTDMQTGGMVTKSIKKNVITQFPMGDNLMNRESEIVTNNGIHVVADDPVSVTVYLSYKWSGEAYRVIPVEWLGKTYYTLNLYQDRTDEFKPAQILIVATQDKTTVKYKPAAQTVRAAQGQTSSVVLNKGQTFLIEGKIIPALNQNWATDLTGTYITATKPIAVISGHTKGAFPLYNYGMPNGYEYTYANFLRNMLCDMMWPVELLGTEYVSVPIFYVNRPRGLTNVQDDKGDLIRFVATEDGTIIKKMRVDGSGMMNISQTLKKGEWYNITNMEDAAYYKSNKRVLVGQYGKTWWNEDVPGRNDDAAKKDGDQPQNPHRNGQGMMLVLAPIDHWCSYAGFKAPTEIDNFFYITFDSTYRDKIYFDGIKLLSKFGGALRSVEGTPYEYVVKQVGTGDHWIEGQDGAKFAAYAYGNWDYTKDGFAYGYPIGVNFASNCKDTLIVTDKIECGNVTGKGVASDLQQDTSCAEVFYYAAKDLENYEETSDFETGTEVALKEVNYNLHVVDPTKPAKGSVTMMTRSGFSVVKNYVYTPEQIEVTPTLVDFGMLKVGETKCLQVQIKNTGTVDATVKSLRLKNPDGSYGKFDIQPAGYTATIAPGDSTTFTVCANALNFTDAMLKNYIIAELSCFEQEINTLQFKMGEPIVTITDARWKDIPVGEEKPQDVKITNTSNVEVVLNTIDWADKTHFTKVENLTLPITIKPYESYTFQAFYKPDTPGQKDSTRALFTGNTVKDKLYSDWIGNGIQAGPYIEGYDWMERRVIDAHAGTDKYKWYVTIDNTSESGTKLGVEDLVILNDPDNVFSVDRANVPSQLNAKDPKQIDAFFAPKEEKVYQADVVLRTKFNNKSQEVTGILQGIGTLPHIKVDDMDFGRIEINKSVKQDIQIQNFECKFGMPLTITGLHIAGPDASAFVIDQNWLNSQTFPIVIPKNSTIQVPVIFTAQRGGTHTAQIVADNDAPEPSTALACNDKPIGDLTGIGFQEGIETTDHHFPTIFRTLSATGGKVYFINNGTDPIALSDDIKKVNDVNNYFTIDDWYTVRGGLTHPGKGSELAAGDSLCVVLSFHPMIEGDYNCQILYSYNNGLTASSNVTGSAMILKTIARIPKDKYIANLNSKDPIVVEFMMDQPAPNVENKPLEQANITSFVAKVHFTNDNNIKVRDVLPMVTGVSDIERTGTMTEGWTCESANIVDGKTLEVKMSGTQPLKINGNSSILFRFRMSCFLSDLDTIPLPCEFAPLGAPAGYVIVDTIPGNIKVNPVCVNTLRFIKFMEGVSSLMTNTPNPVSSKTDIQYVVGQDGNVRIVLFNSLGEKVATLIDQYQKSGTYQITLDVNDLKLTSGVYTYKLEAGSYSDSRQMVVTK